MIEIKTLNLVITNMSALFMFFVAFFFFLWVIISITSHKLAQRDENMPSKVHSKARKEATRKKAKLEKWLSK